MTAHNVHVTFDHEKNEWKVASENAERADSYHTTLQEATKRGEEIAKNRGADLIKHNKDNGQIESRESFSK